MLCLPKATLRGDTMVGHSMKALYDRFGTPAERAGILRKAVKNIRKRSDNRCEGRYVAGHDANGKLSEKMFSAKLRVRSRKH